jgi:two-component system chemotaxis sensor kinase CheA
MDDKLIQIFTEESQEIIETLEQGLLNLEGGEDLELINAVFRAAHTMKGNAGIVGFDDVVALTHNMEGILHEMRKERMKPDAEVVGLLLSAVDALKVMVDSQLAGQTMQAPEEIMSALERLLEPEAETTPVKEPASPAAAAPVPDSPGTGFSDEPKQYKISMRLDKDILTTGNDPLLLLLELGEIGKVNRTICHADDLPAYSELTVDRLYLWWEIYLETAEDISVLDNVFIFVADEGDIKIEELPQGAEASAAQPEARPKPASQKAGPTAAPEPKPAHQPAPPATPQPPANPQPEPAPASAPAPPQPPPANNTQTAPVQKPAIKPAAQAESGQPRKTIPTSSTIRVDTEKLDKLVNLVGELVIGVARINQLSEGQASDELDSAVESLDHISRDLQEQVMRVRMIPVEGTFNRFQRVVRDLASELGKKIKLQMSGIETELDKNVIEQITDPLKHLIRNSADHGLETPEERSLAGKPETGTIWLKAYQQEGKIIIEVEDDGRGIDHNKVLAKAVERGLVESGRAAQPAAGLFLYVPARVFHRAKGHRGVRTWGGPGCGAPEH